MRRFLVRALIVIAILVLVVAAGLAIYAKLRTYDAAPEALAAMQSSELVAVDTQDWIAFRPKVKSPTIGLILYPGGFVDPKAYAPMAHDIAADGYLVVVVPMPINLAVLGAGKASAVIDAFPDIDTWAVGGHSLGGAMAARYAHQNLDRVAGLALWAAYPPDDDDLSARDLAVTSIYGTDDGLTSLEEIENSRALLPPDTRFVRIQGGNHAQFGWYGKQSGDGTASISGNEQQTQIVEATVTLLKQMTEMK